ncbi:MAG TPA: NUDIX domain-containing protein [Pelolinea sp.]|nr:NUDIX domain-containing protein [Pelolinea sp.]
MNYPRVGVATIILRNNQLLLIKRKKSHGAGSWAVPGGHLEYGESLEECAMREMREEVGLEIGNVRFKAITNDLFSENYLHYITIWMKGDCLSSEPIAASVDEVAEWGWFDLDALPSPLFIPLENLIKGRGYPTDEWAGLLH